MIVYKNEFVIEDHGSTVALILLSDHYLKNNTWKTYV